MQDVPSHDSQSTHSRKYSCRNLHSIFEKQIMKRVFEMDYVLLTHQAIGLYTYHLIMLLEFLQMFYFIFFKVPLVNEFLPATDNGQQSMIITQGVNITQIELAQTINISNDLGIVIPESSVYMGPIDSNQLFRFYKFFMFAEWQMFIIESLYPQPFTDTYIAFTIMVFAILIPIALFSRKLFKLVKNDEIKGGLITFLINLLSALFVVFITFMQVPITSFISQGYICNESRLEYYGVPWIICGTSQSFIFMSFTTITLIVYLGFLIIQLQLFTSQEFDSSVPWSEFQRGMPILKMIIKLIMTLDFQYDKGGTNKCYLLLICAPLSAYYVYKRLTDSIFFNKSVQWASIVYDVVNTVCYLVVALHIFSANYIYISTLSFILAFAMILSISLIIYQEKKIKSLLVSSRKALDKFETPSQCETYLFYLHELIQSEKMGDHQLLQGIIATHLDNCEEGFMCQCQDIAQELDHVQQEALLQVMRDDLVEESKSYTNNGSANHMKIQDGLQSMEVENSQIGKLSSNGLSFIKGSDPKKTNGSLPEISSPKEPSQVEIDDDEYPFTLGDLEQRRKIYYRFLFMSIQHAISRFPRNIDLLIMNSSLVKSKMGNHIKAIYELLTCESYSPSLHQKFIIFQRKIAVQQELIKLQNSSNKPNATGLFDSEAIVNYERHIQRFLLNEYLATNSAIAFWKELLQKSINSSLLQETGLEISRCYQNIQDAVQEAQKMQNDDMRFLFRYGLFLIKIVNNEFEGLECFKKVQIMYANRIQRRGRQGNCNELNFGNEHSETSIVIISATAEDVGEIVYANEEIEQMLGYTRNSIINKNVSILMPTVVGRYHNSFIQNFLERGESELLEKHRPFFARTSLGYMQPIDLLVKIYPNISDRILIIGFMKLSEQAIDLNSSSMLKDLEQHHIMTDANGNISSITEGLLFEIGLHPIFFQITSDNNMNTLINFEQICPMIYDPDIQFSLQTDDGTILAIDTTNILQLVELEKLSLEEIVKIRANIGQYQVHIKMKRLIENNKDTSCIFVYRMIILPDLDIAISQGQSNTNIVKFIVDSKKRSIFDESVEFKSEDDQASLNSVSSAASSASLGSIKNVIKIFKQTLGEKKKPQNIKILNWMIMGILLTMLFLSILCYVLLSASINQTNSNIQLSLNAQFRTTLEVQVASNIRSYIDIGSDLEYDMYDVRRLNNLVESRFNVLGRLIQNQASELQVVHEYITQQRSDQSMTNYEFEAINLTRLDDFSLTSTYQQPYRVGMIDFLNDIAGISTLTKEQLNMPQQLIVTQPAGPEYYSTHFPKTTSQIQLAYFLIINGLRDLRTYTENSENFINNGTINNQEGIILIMISAIVISAFAMTLVHYQIWQIEKIQGEVLSLYPHLRSEHINEVYFTCVEYMSAVNEGSLLFQIHTTEENYEQQQVNIGNIGRMNRLTTFNEDEKDELDYLDYIGNNKQGKAEQRRQRAKQIRQQSTNVTNQILKSIKHEIKTLNDKEAMAYTKPVAEETKDINDYSEDRNDKLAKRNHINNKKILKKMGVGEKASQRTMIQDNEMGIQNESESVSENSSRSLNDKPIRREKKKKQGANISEENTTQNQMEDELAMRKKRFQDTLKTQSFGIKIASIVMNLLICAYFVEAYLQQSFWTNQLVQLNGGVPLVLDRFRYSMLSYAMLRERVLYNNSLDSFEVEDSSYGHNIDQMYNDYSIQNEQLILQMKQAHPSILSDIIDFLNIQDSPQLCSQIIGQSVTNISAGNYSIAIGQSSGPGQPNQDQIDSTIKACLAAFQGDVVTLQSLNTDFNKGDYDGRTPLQMAVRGNQLAAVQYLLGAGVQTNTTDRWGATPLNYADQYPAIQALIIQAGGVRGVDQPVVNGQMTQMYDDQWRMYYAAYNNDIATIQLLYYLGWNANSQDIDGRSPLHVAACQGSIDVVSFLVLKQVNFLLLDSRGNDPESDAVRESQTIVANFLDGVVSSYLFIQDCSHFGGGILQQGIHSAIGTFHVQFTDLKLHISSTDSAQTRMSMLSGTQIIDNNTTNQAFNQTILQTYFTAQEIYFSTILNVTMQMIQNTYGNSVSSQQSITQSVFLVFLVIQIVTLFILRKLMIARMIDDVFKSRGILNLIPNHVIEENKTAAEAIMNKLKA